MPRGSGEEEALVAAFESGTDATAVLGDGIV